MKPVSQEMIDLILTQSQPAIAELYDFHFVDGSHDYFTNLDLSIGYNNIVWKANSIRIEGLRFKIGVGWQVDEQQIKISAYPGETLGGASFFSAVESGLLDGAYITRMRGFWAANSQSTYYIYAAAPVAMVTLFTGRVSTIDKIGRTHVELKVKSPLSLLDIDMPRNTYQPGCQWRLFDAGCTLNRASFTSSFTVGTANSLVINPSGGVSPNNGADGIKYYQQGRITFTSGVNDGLVVSIRDNDATSFFLRLPLVAVPAPGDTFTASAGCSKRSETCSTKFSNLHNFRGFPRVPPVVQSV